ncbi:helix-turn-helix domain-containing protein [Roseospira marina]|uniref:helix-turn-helix domain-containing protein n=1 Tax=Roseospira marina TaxID=140057 RepID=UPI001608BFE3|nr:helix-turn-helix domain-containing protein [Roseospira marina]MBB5085345.1 transcriptional regulator with XRE-family HTH domain [Roseospira marina]
MPSHMLDLNQLVRSHMGVTLARLRGERGLRLDEIAAASGLDACFLRAVEAGDVLLDDAARTRLADTLGVDPDCFYDGFMDSLRSGLWPTLQDALSRT